jgi:hypothetical protein
MKKLLSIFLFNLVFTWAQDESETGKDSMHFVFEPNSLFLQVGETGKVNIKLLNQDNELANIPFTIYSATDPGVGPIPTWPGTSLNISPRASDSTGLANIIVKATRPGSLSLKVRSIGVSAYESPSVIDEMKITVPFPPVNHLVFNQMPLNKLLYDLPCNGIVIIRQPAEPAS